MKLLYFLPVAMLLFTACKQQSVEQKIKSSLVERYKAENKNTGVKLEDVSIDSFSFKEVPIDDYFIAQKAAVSDTIKKYYLFGRGAVVADTLLSEISFQKMLGSLKKRLVYMDAIIAMRPTQKLYELHYAVALKSYMNVQLRVEDVFVYANNLKPISIQDDSVFLSQLTHNGN